MCGKIYLDTMFEILSERDFLFDYPTIHPGFDMKFFGDTILHKGGLISDIFSLRLHPSKNVQNHYSELFTLKSSG